MLEQVDGGDLVVNKGTESRPKDNIGPERELGGVEGYDAALKLAQVVFSPFECVFLYMHAEAMTG